MAGEDLEGLDVHVGGVGDEVGQERPPEAVDVKARVCNSTAFRPGYLVARSLK